ncbi:MAG: iron uptake transporter deferrochelatase/peroxidase subunit [Bosea sp. (in: a-proteobacteria)]
MDRDDTPTLPDRRRLFAGLAGLAAAATLPAQAEEAQPLIVPFHGAHQAGIVTPQPYAGLVAAFDLLLETRDELRELFALLTERARFLSQGGRPPVLDPRYPPADSGILGPEILPERLTLTVSVGASLFDERFGLARLRPPELIEMPAFPNDALEAESCHGDLLVQICAETPEETLHALRDIIKHTPDTLSLRWKQEGFAATHGQRRAKPIGAGRNLLGFKDGTANPDIADAAEMDRIVWLQGSGWTKGGSYQVVRLIRNYVERWDRTPLGEQEAIFGRSRDSGAPLGRQREFDDPGYADDPGGARIPLDSHIRLANPDGRRGVGSPLIRRAFNYSNGATRSGQLDMGLLFIAYQNSLRDGFLAVQRRLNGEPLEEYVKPYGGGFFFALPGVPGPDDILGGALLREAGITTLTTRKEG